MRKVRLSGNAGAFLQREAKYLRERGPSAAGAFLDRLREVRRNLAQFPKIGRKKDGLPLEGTMRLVVGDYILDDDLDSEGGDLIHSACTATRSRYRTCRGFRLRSGRR